MELSSNLIATDMQSVVPQGPCLMQEGCCYWNNDQIWHGQLDLIPKITYGRKYWSILNLFKPGQWCLANYVAWTKDILKNFEDEFN